jgi:hypothetical protein
MISDAEQPANPATPEALDQYYGAGASGPRVTLELLRNSVKETHYRLGRDVFDVPIGHHPLALMTLCVLVLENGFFVIGMSACVSPENFDEEKGRTSAYKHAFDQLWALYGFQMRTDLYRQALHDIEEIAHGDSTGPVQAV